MNQQEITPAKMSAQEEKIRRTLAPFLSPSETLRSFAYLKNQPSWLSWVFSSLALVWFRRYWYAATTEQNVYFIKQSLDPKSVFKVPRKDIQINGNVITFTLPDESKPRKLYLVLEYVKWGGKFKEDLQNPDTTSGRFIGEGVGVQQSLSQLNQTPIAQEKASETQEEVNGKSRRNWGLVFTIVGGLLALVGTCATVVLIFYAFSTEAADAVRTGGVMAVIAPFICSVPLLAIGVGALFFGIRRLRSAPTKENKTVDPGS